MKFATAFLWIKQKPLKRLCFLQLYLHKTRRLIQVLSDIPCLNSWVGFGVFCFFKLQLLCVNKVTIDLTHWTVKQLFYNGYTNFGYTNFKLMWFLPPWSKTIVTIHDAVNSMYRFELLIGLTGTLISWINLASEMFSRRDKYFLRFSLSVLGLKIPSFY